jgi:hypothetical protein
MKSGPETQVTSIEQNGKIALESPVKVTEMEPGLEFFG